MAEGASADGRREIAIVGMGCRFPGARNVNDYWRLLANPRPQFRPIPEARWRHSAFLDDGSSDPYAAYTDTMAILPDVGMFDAAHYQIPPRRARSMDPQHRLLIDLAREAIQDAGWEIGGFEKADTAVIMGVSESGYREMSTVNIRLRQIAGGEFGPAAAGPGWAEAGSAIRGFHATALPGLLLNMGPASISSAFNLHGGSYAVDAACSGGLAAVADAVEALRAGRCKIALAGGAQLILVPDLLLGLCRVGAISPSGTCRPFDARADGVVLGEGAGVLALRPLADARAAGDRVYAVITGVGMSNDGTVRGGMLPQAEGQLLALRRAYADAGLPPGAVGYLEAHGTATSAGDEVEVNALWELRKEETTPAYLGAAKAVVGHCLAASGLAGLVKAALSIHNGQIAPQPEFELAGHPGLAEAGLEIPTALTQWEAGRQPRRAGVSAFGFGGTNVHVVLEEAAPVPVPETAGRQLLVLSARDRAGLARYARDVAEVLARESVPLAAVAVTLAGRAPFAERLAVIADTEMDAIGKLMTASILLEAGRTGDLAPAVVAGLVPPGQERAVDLAAADRGAALEEAARGAVSGQGLTLVMPARPPCTLPPSPLSPQEHWIVDRAKAAETPCHPVPAPRPGAPQPRAPQPPVPQPRASQAPAPQAPAPQPTAPRAVARVTDTLDIVLEEIVRISAFPKTDLHQAQALAADLGFDSLMLTELEANLTRRLPELPIAIDLDNDFTIGELITAIAPDRSAMGLGPPATAPAWDSSAARVEDFPEVAAFEARFGQLDVLGVPNPYFRIHQGNLRNTTTIGDRDYVSFSGYNYLGLSGHPAVSQAVCDAVERYGSSVSASRLLAGERQLTRQLEAELAGLLNTPAALALVSGHATNVTAIGHITGPGDLIVHDSLAHDSVLQGCKLSGATRRPFPHNDLGQLEHILQRTRSGFRRVLLIVEGAYSMDGDLVDLPSLIELKKRHGALILIDEAHSIGTVGQHGGGTGEFFGVDRGDVDLWMGTLSKALASCGGYLAGSARTISWLRYTLPGFIYSVGLTPANAAAALAAIGVVRSEPQRLAALRRNAELFLALAQTEGIATGSAGRTPIVPCIVGDSGNTLRLASRLFARGIVADPILHPAVAEHETRLRFFLTSEHTEEEIRSTVSALSEELRSLP
jgi:7-keto-8-aminopelargonate synthetase-like enzyme/3-oxoacyl-(acyl-carrier-protein) synthase